MAERIVATGRAVVVHDRAAGALNVFEGRATVAGSVGEVARSCEIVLACLPHKAATVEVFGQLRAANGRMRIFVQTGTSGADLFECLDRRGVELVDAPVTGGVPRARQGDLTVIVAGADAAVREVEDLLGAFASKLVRVSDRPGDGQRVKLINNFLSAANLALACEALVLTRGAGIDPRVMLEVVNNGSGQNNATLSKLPDYVVPRNFSRGGRLGLMLKDLTEAARLAQESGVPIPLGDAVRAGFERAIEFGAPDDDVTSVVRHMEDAAGLPSD